MISIFFNLPILYYLTRKTLETPHRTHSLISIFIHTILHINVILFVRELAYSTKSLFTVNKSKIAHQLGKQDNKAGDEQSTEGRNLQEDRVRQVAGERSTSAGSFGAGASTDHG